jgi:leucyl aminopeptidase
MRSRLPVTIVHALTSENAIVCPVFQQDDLAGLDPLGPAAAARLRRALDAREFRAKPNELFFDAAGPDDALRLIAVGLGERKDDQPDRWRHAVSTGVWAARNRGFARVAVCLRQADGSLVQAAAEGAALASLDVDAYRTTDRDAVALEQVNMLRAGAGGPEAQATTRGAALGHATNTARILANEPPNVLSPQVLAERAAAIAGECGLGCEVLGEKDLERLGMRLLLGVGQGSVHPPRLVVLRHEPAGAPPGVTLGLVGKGVTFDTGGISIKPADKMELMKYDMAGAAAVIGAMEAIGTIRPPVRVVGVVPIAENMPSGSAIRPGDVITAASGKTVEINNTDAEGRLILADALWYAREMAGATHLVDVATLTGACVVALGQTVSGLFGNRRPWTDRVLETANRTGDLAWPLPLFEEYAEQLRSDIADLVNTGGRAAGAVTAAKFLEAFVGELPWVHLDVAGTAWLEESKPWMPKGPTGVMTRALAELALGWRPLE